jgi:hypothetical protein
MEGHRLAQTVAYGDLGGENPAVIAPRISGGRMIKAAVTPRNIGHQSTPLSGIPGARPSRPLREAVSYRAK